MYRFPKKGLKKLPKETERKLLRAAKAGDLKSRDQLILAHTKWALSMVKQFRKRATRSEDAIASTYLELFKLVEEFDFSHRNKLSTFAWWRIRKCLTKMGKVDLKYQHMLGIIGMNYIRDPTVKNILDVVIRKEECEEAYHYVKVIDDVHRDLLIAEAYNEGLLEALEVANMSLAEYRAWKKEKKEEIWKERNWVPLYVCRNRRGEIVTVICKGWHDTKTFLQILKNQASEVWVKSVPPTIWPDDVYTDYFVCIGEDKYRNATRNEYGAFAGTAGDITEFNRRHHNG